MLQTINNLFTKVFDIVLTPFRILGPFWEIVFLSILSALIVLIVYKYVSSPAKIKDTKNKIKSSILAIRLYKDFGLVIIGSFFKSLYYTGKYFVLNFGPVLIILPFLLIPFFQMDVRYGMRGFEPGEEIVLKASFLQSLGELEVKLQDSEYYTKVMNPIFIDSFDMEGEPIREVNWRLKAQKKGSGVFRIQVGADTFLKNLVIGRSSETLSNSRFYFENPDFWQFWYPFVYPVEKALEESGPVQEIWISYPGKTIPFLILDTHWLVYYLILVVIFVFALKNRFGVEF
jgi:hypothetical protein